MRFFRGLLAIVFAGIIFVGLWKWYSTDNGVSEKDVMLPVREKIGSVFVSSNKEKPTITTPSIGSTKPNGTVSLHPDITQGSLLSNQLENLKQSAKILGNTDADFTLYIFCDYSVGYCKQFHNDDYVSDYQDIFTSEGKSLSYSYLPFPKSPNGETLSLHTALACMQSQASSNQIIDLQTYMYRKKTPSLEDVNTFAKRINIEDLTACATSEQAKVALQQRRETNKQLFSISSLPTLILINNKQSSRHKIPGLYENKELTPSLRAIAQK